MSIEQFGNLYIVATPIGNLDDLTPRAIETLKTVDLIAAEDTRHAKKLLQHFGIQTPMVAYHDHNERDKSSQLIGEIQKGKQLALISDAGTPLISDPGYRLTALAHEQNVSVIPVVGACAAIAALSVSGLASDKFSFEGFLPNKPNQRQIKLEQLKNQTQTMIFYESPHRILATLADMRDVFGKDRMACLCRELTKTFETVKQANIDALYQFVSADNNQQKGEIVLVISGATENTDTVDEKALAILKTLLEYLPPKKATAVTSQLTGIKKNTLYDHALLLKTPNDKK